MGIHRNVIHPKFGNFILLGTVLIGAEATTYDQPVSYNPCLECKLCVAACPVGAISPNGDFNFSACYTHNYREFLGGFTDWVEQIADSKNALERRAWSTTGRLRYSDNSATTGLRPQRPCSTASWKRSWQKRLNNSAAANRIKQEVSMLDSELKVNRFLVSYCRMLVEDIADERLAEQPLPGVNHPAWILGHLAFSADRASSLLDASKELPATWTPLFGPGSKPSTAGPMLGMSSRRTSCFCPFATFRFMCAYLLCLSIKHRNPTVTTPGFTAVRGWLLRTRGRHGVRFRVELQVVHAGQFARLNGTEPNTFIGGHGNGYERISRSHRTTSRSWRSFSARQQLALRHDHGLPTQEGPVACHPDLDDAAPCRSQVCQELALAQPFPPESVQATMR